MTPETHARLGDALFEAMRGRTTLAPFTETEPGITIDDAYRIARRMIDRRLALGERIVGKKIGVTSEPVQKMLGVFEPDFGWLTSDMVYGPGQAMPIGRLLIQPRAEAEIAFFLGHTLRGPGVTEADVLAATAFVAPCFEVVDSRIRDWKIRIQDTVADNASCGLLMVGAARVDPRTVNLETCEVVVHKNGQPLSRGFGAAALGSPLRAVAWLANTLSRFDVALEAGELVLSGSLVPLEPVVPGDRMTMNLTGIGDAELVFE